MMPYFVRLPNGKYGQFDVATSKFVHADLSVEDVRQRAGEMAAALGLSFDCEKIAGDVAKGAIVDANHKDAPYSDHAGHGVRRYVGCIKATLDKYGRSMARQFVMMTMGNEADGDVFPAGFWLNGLAAKVRPIVGVSTPQEKVCVGYVVKKTRYQKQDEWWYMSVATTIVAWYPSQKEAARFTRVKAREIVRLVNDTNRAIGDDRTYKIVRIMRRLA